MHFYKYNHFTNDFYTKQFIEFDLHLMHKYLVKTKDMDAVEGKSVSLPCPISAPLDDVYMVLWFRDNAGIPLYR